MKNLLLLIVLSMVFIAVEAQQATHFQKVGNQSVTVQDLFPGSHRARPVMADFTNNGFMGLFYGGQDLGGSTGWYYKKLNKDTRWGDQGDGTYVNPIINADYSDPDVIRVGEKYYMTCSDFHFMGIPVLESEDMVNWKIIGQVYDRLDFSEYDKNERYGGGSWAPALRYHDNKFWIFFCTPNEGLFMSNATNPAGPWAPLVHVKNIGGWEDPCPLWDDDGQAYFGRSQLGGGPIILHKMKPDGTALLDDGTTIYTGDVAEGTKLFKKDGYYYLSIPEGGVSTGWQTVLRSQNIYGPYEKKIVLEQGTTDVNGPHQGAFVDTPEGEWWFYHFQSKEPIGRIVHLQPVHWEEDWPMVGVDKDMNGIGEPVKEWKKPKTNKQQEPYPPQTSDDFSSDRLGLQWQFNHNPVDANWSLTEHPGNLTIKALKADKLQNAKNMLTQKSMGYFGEAVTELNCSRLAEGQRAGLTCIGNRYTAIGVMRKNNENYVYVEFDDVAEQMVKVPGETVYLKVFLNSNSNENQFYYSFDHLEYIACKDQFSVSSGNWKGFRVGLFSYNTASDSGEVDFNWFEYQCDGPGGFTYEEDDTPGYADWSVWNEMAVLVKNNGDGTFSLVQEYDANIQVTIWTNSVFFDYDNDGNLDLLVVGKGGDWRYPMSTKYALLYRNLGEAGGYLFEEVKNAGLKQYCDEMYFNTISIGDYDNDGYNDVLIMCYDNSGRSVDLYKNDQGNGKFILQKNALPKDASGTLGSFYPASNGAVMFGDINNDGWLDIFYTGYSNVARGIRIYLNRQDGTFKDITPDNIAGSFESQSVLSDVNGDGTLDVLVTGHGDNWARFTELYYNTINVQTKMPEFTLAQNIGIIPINKANVLIADFNNDGRMDLIMNGYDGTNDLTRVYYQNENQTFILDGQYPIFPTKDGGINMGDSNGDNNMDIIIAGYKGSNTADNAYASPVSIYENKPSAAGIADNQPPSAPSDVKASYGNGKLTITWEPATDNMTAQQALRYNVFVKNNSTSKTWMMIPADTNTGRVKVGTDLQTSLSAYVKEYVMNIPEGDYTIGVQALDQSYAGGAFRTTTDVVNSIICQKISDNEHFNIKVTKEGFVVSSPVSSDVTVFNP